MTIEQIDDFDAFLALEPAWNDLCRRAGMSSFFASHAWFRCCWEARAEGLLPLVLVAREAGEVVGLAPFFVHTLHWRIFPMCTASLMQNQDSPFVEIPVDSDRRREVLALFVRHLERMPKLQVVSLKKIRRSSCTHRALLEVSASSALVRSAGGGAPVLSLRGGWDQFWKAQSQRFKKTVRNVANRVERLGHVTLEEISHTAPAAACLDVYSRIAERSWKSDLPVSFKANPRIFRFFEILTPILHAERRLLLWVLHLDGIPVAAEYHVHDGDTVYALRSDFDDRYREASPGAYLNDRIVRTYFERNDVEVYDMGPGDNAYKQRWATGARDFDEFSFFNRRPYARTVYRLEQHAVPHLRQVRDWWRRDSRAVASGGEA
jgi:CelD/BcsL family acetyltransferase involved in cellulose biosynthesis